MSERTVHPVAIIGGGAVGLSSSILLSLRNIPHVLFERHPDTAIHPRSCGINQRTSEIFRVMGIEDAVYAVSAPPDIGYRTAWYTSLGPDGQEIGSRDTSGSDSYEAEYAKHSPSKYATLPQIRLEPILRQRAQELNAAGIKYSAEVTDLTEQQGSSYAVLKVRYAGREDDEEVRARFVICADGGRSFTDRLGVAWIGERNIADMITAHFCAPLRAAHPDPRNFITWFTHPDMGGSVKTGAIYQIGPWPLDGAREEWCYLCMAGADDPQRFDHETMAKRIRTTLHLPDLPIEMLSISPWKMNAIHAERYRVGKRVFLVGDAAHRITPWGALGMNTGVQDASNLVWKLDLALEDEQRYDGLLGSYDLERRPVGARVARTSLRSLRGHSLVVDAALGMSAAQTAEQNRAALAAFFDPAHPEHTRRRANVQRALKAMDCEFKAPGTEVGWFYPCADFDGEGDATLHDGQLDADGDLNMGIYIASTLPGHHVPHVWLRKDAFDTVALRDLIPSRKMLLITTWRGMGWEQLEGELVHMEVIGQGGWEDGRGEWARVCAVSKDGGVLVRPDGMVAWRGEWEGTLRDKWDDILARVLYIGK